MTPAENDSRPPSKLLLRRWFCLPAAKDARRGRELNINAFKCPYLSLTHVYLYIYYIYILYQRYNKQIYYFSLNKKCIDIGYDMYIYTYIILLLLLLLSLLLLSLLLYIIYSDILGFRKHRDSKYLPSAWESPAVWDLASQWRPPVAFHHPSS